MRCFPAARRAVFGLSLLLVACSDDLTAPAAPVATPVEHTSEAESQTTAAIASERAVAVGVEDALERILPMLGAEARVANLGATLRSLVAALEAGNGAAVTRSASQAEEAIAVLNDRSDNEIESRVHLDLVGLVVARAGDLEFSADGRDRSVQRKNEEEHDGR